jgi:WD40 repeat protein
VRIFNYITNTLTATLRGHRSAVTCLAVDSVSFPSSSGVISASSATPVSLLATGSADNDIIIWDLISFQGIIRFTGEHKDAITALSFLSLPSKKLLISVSKDTLLKIWDLETKHCIQTIVGHRNEIWSLSFLIPFSVSQEETTEEDLSRIRIFTGSSDELIRVYRFNSTHKKEEENGSEERKAKKARIDPSQQSLSGEASSEEKDENQLIRYYGSLERSTGVDRCSSLSLNSKQNILAGQSAGKSIDVSEFFALFWFVVSFSFLSLLFPFSFIVFVMSQKLKRKLNEE